MLKRSFFLSTFLFLLSCASLAPTYFQAKNWSKEPLVVQTLALFNQRTKTMSHYRSSWEGDWLFRRKRLALVDKSLTEDIPNLIFFQEMLEKNHNDSDAAILGSSSLAYYQGFPVTYKKHDEIEETESASVYLRLDDVKEEVRLMGSELWKIEDSGYLSFQKLLVEGSPLYLFNLKMPENTKAPEKAFIFIRDKVNESLKKNTECINHVILAGHFGTSHFYELNLLMRSLNLVDTGADFCYDKKHSCDTQDPSNSIFNASSLPNNFARTERVFVHKSTLVTHGKVAYKHKGPSLPALKTKYKLHSLSPSLRNGWETHIKFGKCQNR